MQLRRLNRIFPTWGMGRESPVSLPLPPTPPPPTSPKFAHSHPHLEKKNRLSPLNNNFQHNIFGCSHHSCQIFILTSYSLYTQVMLMFFFNNVQYLQNVSFEKSSNGKNHCSSGSHYPIKNSYFPFRKI